MPSNSDLPLLRFGDFVVDVHARNLRRHNKLGEPLHAESVSYRLSVDREVETEIPGQM